MWTVCFIFMCDKSAKSMSYLYERICLERFANLNRYAIFTFYIDVFDGTNC